MNDGLPPGYGVLGDIGIFVHFKEGGWFRRHCRIRSHSPLFGIETDYFKKFRMLPKSKSPLPSF